MSKCNIDPESFRNILAPVSASNDVDHSPNYAALQEIPNITKEEIDTALNRTRWRRETIAIC